MEGLKNATFGPRSVAFAIAVLVTIVQSIEHIRREELLVFQKVLSIESIS